MRLLELFSGTHSVGKVASGMGFDIVSLDRDIGGECPFGFGYKSKNHFKEDIMTWNYKQFPEGHFDLITASPVCLWWSSLRRTWIGRKLKGMNRNLTAEDIEKDKELFGIPMVDKVLEILDYFKPKFWWIENPKTGSMKDYINDLLPYVDLDYCMYGMDYKKRTRIWTNIPFRGNLCDGKCSSLKEGTKHKDISKDYGGGSNRLERYVIPRKLIIDLLTLVIFP